MLVKKFNPNELTTIKYNQYSQKTKKQEFLYKTYLAK